MSKEKSEEFIYSPVKDGIEKDVESVVYIESKPPSFLNEFVHCFWELKTQKPLLDDFCYHVLPDACVNLLFNQFDTEIAAITALQTNYKKLNLGKEFHYVGVQLLPGVWKGKPEEIKSDLVDTPYLGSLSLVKVNKELQTLSFSLKQSVLARFIAELIEHEIIVTNEITSQILQNINNIQTVSDMAHTSGLSPRQLQRRIKDTVGLSPHDFLKILRIQQTFKEDYLTYYSDQSHYIHSFRKITGHTPKSYSKKFDV